MRPLHLRLLLLRLLLLPVPSHSREQQLPEEEAALRSLETDPQALRQDPALDTVLGDPTSAAVRKSTIPGAGRGAFALRAFAMGEHLGVYKCRMVPYGEGDRLYTWTVNASHKCDASQVKLHNPMRYVNSIGYPAWTCDVDDPAGGSGGSRSSQNARQVQASGSYPSYYATRPIEAGEEILVNYGRDYFNIRGGEDRLLPPFQCGMTELSRLSARGDLEGVKHIVMASRTREGAAFQVDGVRGDGEDDAWTPLMASSAAGHHEVVSYLLEHGASTWRTDKSKSRSAAMLAAINDHPEVLRALLFPPSKDSSTGAGGAGGANGGISAADPNEPRSKSGSSPLFMAAQQGRVRAVRVLLEAERIDVNARGASGATPLLIAAWDGNEGVVKAILEHPKVEVDAKAQGLTPLWAAASKGHVGIVRALLLAGAAVTGPAATGDHGWSPETVARRNGHAEVVALLQREQQQRTEL